MAELEWVAAMAIIPNDSGGKNMEQGTKHDLYTYHGRSCKSELNPVPCSEKLR